MIIQIHFRKHKIHINLIVRRHVNWPFMVKCYEFEFIIKIKLDLFEEISNFISFVYCDRSKYCNEIDAI